MPDINKELMNTSIADPVTGLYENNGTGTADDRAAADRARMDAAHRSVASDTSDKSAAQKIGYHAPSDFSFAHISELAGRVANGAKSALGIKSSDPLAAAVMRRSGK